MPSHGVAHKLGGRRAARKRRGWIVDTVQVVSPITLSEMPTDSPLSRDLRLRDDVALLRVMGVAEDMWGQGISTQLGELVIEWCRLHEIRTLVLNTTTPQKPAIGLYNKLGFLRDGPNVLGQI